MDADVSGGRPRKPAPEEDDPEFWETIGGRRVPIKGADKGGDDAEVEARFADSMVLYKYALARSQLLNLMKHRRLLHCCCCCY